MEFKATNSPYLVATEDCASRVLSEKDTGKAERHDDERNENEEGAVKADSAGTRKNSAGKKKAETVGGESNRQGKSEYEIQKEKNIAANQVLLAQIKNPEFEAIMRESSRKDPQGSKNKGKTQKPKPNEERRTSARLAATEMSVTHVNST
jgi:hypothetical protein